MAEEQLNLLQLPAGGTAEFGAGAAEVVGLELASQLLAVKSDRSEHGLRGKGGAGDLAVPVQRPEQASLRDRRSFRPEIDGQLDPGRHRNGS